MINKRIIFEISQIPTHKRFRKGYVIITTTELWQRYKKSKFVFTCNLQINQKSSIQN